MLEEKHIESAQKFIGPRLTVRLKLLDEAVPCDRCGCQQELKDTLADAFVLLETVKLLKAVLDRSRRQLAYAKAQEQSLEDIRDAVLYGRYQLAEMCVDSDITNAVLGIIDDHTLVPEEFMEGPSADEVLQKAYGMLVTEDSYGVPGSEFSTCTVCGAGGSPTSEFRHAEECPVLLIETYLHGSGDSPAGS